MSAAPLSPESRAASGAATGIFVLLGVGALYAGSALLRPVAFAVLFMFLLGPLVRWLRARGMREGIAAAVVVFGAVGVLGAGVTLLSGPASAWVKSAPAVLTKVERRMRTLMRPLSSLQRTAERIDDATTPGSGAPSAPTSSPGLLATLGSGTLSAAASTLTVIFLTYFLLASGRLFRAKIQRMASGPEQREHLATALTEIEGHMSRYLLLNTIIGLVVGAATWGLLAWVGLPNAPLWAAAAFVLNFVPYVGALATLVLIAVASLVTFDDTSRLFYATGGFFVINLIEGNLVTPMILGSRMPLNSVAIFTGLLFWSFVWGVPGAIIAVPLTVMIQVICAHTERWKRLGVLLDN